MRPSNKSPGKKKTRKSRASGRGKWMIVGNIARHLISLIICWHSRAYWAVTYFPAKFFEEKELLKPDDRKALWKVKLNPSPRKNEV
ncbi:hypothetical protein P8452_52496 [Trifolium repens]|nr:hypothetical protein P8452_52496 [Trifolium repens]